MLIISHSGFNENNLFQSGVVNINSVHSYTRKSVEKLFSLLVVYQHVWRRGRLEVLKCLH